jgi:hypothetical protein
MKGNVITNDSISCSFDPSKLNCISCAAEHGIVGKDPLTVIFTDQNFPGTLSCKNGKCINILRLENPSLSELFEIAREVFSHVPLPAGSIFLFGSSSELGRSGTSLYARGWTEVVARSSDLWPGVRICPLIPLIATECPGSIVRELGEFSTWLEKVYDSDPQGLRDSWTSLVKAMETCSVGMTTTDIMETYKVVLPSTITTRALDQAVTFCSNSTRPVVFKGLPKDLQSELLGTLLNLIFDNFRACLRPEEYLARADVGIQLSENREQKVLLVGASNLMRSVPHFTDPSLMFVDETQPGWTASPENVKKMKEKIETIAANSAGIVFDILGNSSVRYEQFDGNTALPFRSNGRFHLGGKVVTTPRDIFKKTVENVIPLFRAKGSTPCVIVPPLPRYLFARCCNDGSHCSNAKEDAYAENLLKGFLQLRADLIRQLVQSGLTNFKVLDSCCVCNCEKTANVPERIAALKVTTTPDGIHFTDIGNNFLATRAIACLKSLIEIPPKKSAKRGTFFWRGFRSPVGSGLPRSCSISTAVVMATASRGAYSSRSRGRPRGYHPYKRW